MNSRKSSTNNLVRQVLKEIIADPPSTRRPELEQLKVNEAVTYLERKIERQQSEVKMLSQQLGKEIQTKEQLISMLNDQKQKTLKLNQHLSNSNKIASQAKKKLAKFQAFQARQAKLKQQYELKLVKSRQMLRKKEQQLAKASLRVEQLQSSSSNMFQIEKELKQLRDKLVQMGEREAVLLREVESLRGELQEEREELKLKQEAVLFSQEHLNRLRSEFQELEDEQAREQQQSRQLQLEMKDLLSKQNHQIKDLNQRISLKEIQVLKCMECSKSFVRNEIHQFLEKPQWDLNIFKNELRRAITLHIKENPQRNRLQKDLLIILEAVESSFNGILNQIMQEIPQ